MTYYKVNKYAATIVPVQVIGETAKFITLDMCESYNKNHARRVAKSDEYFPSFKEAREHLMDHFKKRSEFAKSEMDRYDAFWNKLFMQETPDAQD